MVSWFHQMWGSATSRELLSFKRRRTRHNYWVRVSVQKPIDRWNRRHLTSTSVTLLRPLVPNKFKRKTSLVQLSSKRRNKKAEGQKLRMTNDRALYAWRAIWFIQAATKSLNSKKPHVTASMTFKAKLLWEAKNQSLRLIIKTLLITQRSTSSCSKSRLPGCNLAAKRLEKSTSISNVRWRCSCAMWLLCTKNWLPHLNYSFKKTSSMKS